MTEKKIVKDALLLAETVAEIIFENSFKYDDGGVLDILLFGSALKGPAHDIDMLVIHNDPYLNELGVITTYDEKTSCCVPDLNAKGLEKEYDAKVILQCMGSPLFPNELEASSRILDKLREGPKDYTDTGRYSGTLDLPYLGEVEVKATNFEQLLAMMNGLDRQLHALTVCGKVKELFDKKGLGINETLDLQAMNVLLLSPKESHAEERRLAIQQCTDPTFWHTLLTTGKLYSKETGKFTDPIQEKYPMAIELFKQ